MTTGSINVWVLRAFLNTLGTADSDEDEEEFADFPSEDEGNVRALIHDRIRPYYERWGPDSKIIGKNSLAYWLTFRRDNLEWQFNAANLPLRAPGEWPEEWEKQAAWIERFFVLIWEELFGPEDYHLADPEAYEVRNDPEESNWILKR